MTRIWEMTSGEIESLVEEAYNEGWRDRETKPSPMINSRGEMRRSWLESNARDAALIALGEETA